MREGFQNTLLKRSNNSKTEPIPQGVTAIELLAVIGIASLLALLAVPSFTPLIQQWKLNQTSDQIISTLNLARSEALKRGGNVRIEKLNDNDEGCISTADSDWSCGWSIYWDANNDSLFLKNANDADILIQSVITKSNTRILRDSSGKGFTIDRWGNINLFAVNGIIISMPNERGATSIDTLLKRKICIFGAIANEVKWDEACP